jgi:Tripartite tricarboxylate transporter TctB family
VEVSVLRSDHVAGAAFVTFGVIVFALSGDLPLGSMGMPGAGMMPKLVVGFMIAFGVILMLRAGESPPFVEIKWDDLPHAVRVIAVTAAAIGFYEIAGFILTMTLLMLILLALVERRPLLNALAFSVGVTVFAYILFGSLLKSPLPAGLLGF